MIKREDFLKLKQSDRIEYLLRLKRIEETNESDNSLDFGWKGIFMFGFFILVALGVGSIAGAEAASSILGLYPKLVFGFSLGLGICLIADILYITRYSKQKAELESEFFKVEVKKKK